MKHPIRLMALLAVFSLFFIALAFLTNTPQRVLADDPTSTPTPPEGLIPITLGGVTLPVTFPMGAVCDGTWCDFNSKGSITCDYTDATHGTIACSGSYDYDAACGTNHLSSADIGVGPAAGAMDLNGLYYYDFHASTTIITNPANTPDTTYLHAENAAPNPQYVLSADEAGTYPSGGGWNYHVLTLHSYFSNPDCTKAKLDSFTYRVSLSDLSTITPSTPTPTPTRTATHTLTYTPTATATATLTKTITVTPTKTLTQTVTTTRTPTATATFYPFTAVKVWNFTSGAQSWTAIHDVSNFAWDSGGYIEGDITGTDPYIASPTDLDLDVTTNKFIRIRYKNTTSYTTAKFYFITNTDANWDETKSIAFTVVPNSDYTLYEVNLSDVTDWTDGLKRLRFDPAGSGSGSFSIDYINVGGPFAPVLNWTYDTTVQSWTDGTSGTSGFGWLTGGYIGATITNGNAKIFSPTNLNVDISNAPTMKIRFKNATGGIDAYIYYMLGTDTYFSGGQVKAFHPNDNAEYTEYVLTMPANWTGTLKQLRIDLPGSSGSFGIDYIRIGVDEE